MAALGVPPPRESSVRKHDPEGTLVSRRNEADELRRRIANPGIPEPEGEMDLEEIVEVGAAPGVALEVEAPEVVSPPSPPPPVEPPTEVEVPIDIEIAPGTSRVHLNLRLVLNLKRR
jgi:hypothetical protein